MVIILKNNTPMELTDDEVYDAYRVYRICHDYEALKEQCVEDRELVAKCDCSQDELIYDALQLLDASSYPDCKESDVASALFSVMVRHGLLRRQ